MAAVVLATSAIYAWDVIARTKRKQTLTRIRTIATICDAAQPYHVDPDSLVQAAQRLGVENFGEAALRDAWGKPILVRREGSVPPWQYTVAAFGESDVSGDIDSAPYLWSRGQWIRLRSDLN